MHVTLAPKVPFAPSPEPRRTRYSGTLKVRIADDRGQVWERAYMASGDLDLEGEAVAMPTGLVLPGASSPSPEAEALRIKLDGPLAARMDVSLFDDPRTH